MMIQRILAIGAVLAAMGIGLLALSPDSGEALPTETFLFFPGPGDGYVGVADAPELEPQDALTWEMWVYMSEYASWNGNNTCPSLIGKEYFNSHWVGICSGRIRFYPGETESQDSVGMVPLETWTHIAVTYDEAAVRFYIDGAFDSEFGMTAALGDSPDNLRIGSDASWAYSPKGGIDEVRLWNVVRSDAEILGAKDTTIVAAEYGEDGGYGAGLVAVWNFEGSPVADVGGFGGTLVGDAVIGSGPVPTPVPGVQWRWGDANCDDAVDPVDSLAMLRYDAGLSVNQEPDCPVVGGAVGVAGNGPTEREWADANCDGEVNPVDSLVILRFDGKLGFNQVQGCPGLGEFVNVTLPI